jgi:hypothetical protein
LEGFEKEKNTALLIMPATAEELQKARLRRLKAATALSSIPFYGQVAAAGLAIANSVSRRKEKKLKKKLQMNYLKISKRS